MPNNAQKSENFLQKIRAKVEEKPDGEAAKAALKAKNYDQKNNRPKCAIHIKNVEHLFVEHLQIFTICSAASTVAATIYHH